MISVRRWLRMSPNHLAVLLAHPDGSQSYGLATHWSDHIKHCFVQDGARIVAIIKPKWSSEELAAWSAQRLAASKASRLKTRRTS